MASLISCADMYDNVKEYATAETVYPGCFDTISYRIGYERAEIDLLKAGRIPSAEINMGKAKKTVISYDGKEIVYDSLCSWVNLTGLNVSKLYRINACTEDEFGNRSVPQEISLIPFTASDLEILTVANPRVIASPWAVSLSWNNMSSVLLNYCDLNYRYTDKDGNVITGEGGENPLIIMQNLNAGKETSIDLNYRVVPKVSGEEILDTLILQKTFYMYMPTSDAYQKALESRSISAMILTSSQDIKLTFNQSDDHTLQYTEIKYIDATDPSAPVEKLLRVENSETIVTVPGLRLGTTFSVRSNYKPDGVEGVFVDSDFRDYKPTEIDYERTGWTVTTTHQWASDSQGPNAILDENYASFLSLAKPGKSVNGSTVPSNEFAGFIIDMKQTVIIDYYRIMHRNTTVGLRIWEASVYGSADGVNWQPIKENNPVAGYAITGTLVTPNMPVPRSGFQFLKVLITKWDTVNNSAAQLAEFYVGMNTSPILN